MMDLNEPRTLGCRCSDRQLGQVGCDCAFINALGTETYPLMIARVFKRGYASDDQATFEYLATPWFDPDQHARDTYGSFARVFDKRLKYRPKDTRTPEEKAEAEARARYYTQGDNT